MRKMSVRARNTVLAALIVAFVTACTIFPRVHNVTISGVIRDGGGAPLPGVSVYFAVLRFQPGMPGVGESGFVISDDQGRYSLHIEEVYDAVSLSEIGSEFGCGTLIDLSWEQLKAQPVQVRDFICDPAGNTSGGIRKELPPTRAD
jgi:hypothetical protein